MGFSHNQMVAIDLTEKIGSVVSILGALFVILTFTCSSKFRKPINRLVFYASFGNILTNIATIIGTSAMNSDRITSLCKFQGFMIQWFLLTDALWTCCMAINVYLSFFHHYGANELRRLEWKYALACYGIPAVPAIIYFFVHTKGQDPVYGHAVLWCWVSKKWRFLRIAVFYGPAWIVILLTWGIYLRVGFLIFRWRRQLRLLGQRCDAEMSRSCDDAPAFGIRRTEEISITTELMVEPPPTYVHPPWKASRPSITACHTISPDNKQPSNYRYRAGARGDVECRRSSRTNKAAIKYCKCAVLFSFALLCTWVPSTVNRIYTLVHPNETPFGTTYAAGLVLPLQGFWNFVIYVTTSRWACRSLWNEIKEDFSSRRWSRRILVTNTGSNHQNSSSLTLDSNEPDEKQTLQTKYDTSGFMRTPLPHHSS